MEEMILMIDTALAKQKRVIVAIDGDAAAGKTSLSHKLAAHYNCQVIHMDDFFLPPKLRTPKRMEEAGGNVDYERFKTEVLTPMLEGKPFSFRAFDCGAMEFADEITIRPFDVVIVEGSYSLHPALNHAYDIKVFMEVEKDEQMRRVRKRNGAAMAEKFEKSWIPMEKRYHKAFEIKKMCHVVITTI
ncbi:MAG: hypothetical protein FWB74_07905 [Defluviitaleaceae bacterium]|nr:hypothetical protein [Defluviitaleaceae bacterium]